MPLGSISPFRPSGTSILSAGTASTSVALAGGGESVVVTNTSTSLVFVRFGADPTVAATTGDMPVLPGSRVLLAVNSLISYAAGVCQTGSATVYFSRGDGSVI